MQVLRNLINNAISFSPVGGVIALTLMADPDQITLAVEDAGPGIPAGKLDNVFERFYSERPAGEKFGTHSGLGLEHFQADYRGPRGPHLGGKSR